MWVAHAVLASGDPHPGAGHSEPRRQQPSPWTPILGCTGASPANESSGHPLRLLGLPEEKADDRLPDTAPGNPTAIDNNRLVVTLGLPDSVEPPPRSRIPVAPMLAVVTDTSLRYVTPSPVAIQRTAGPGDGMELLGEGDCPSLGPRGLSVRPYARRLAGPSLSVHAATTRSRDLVVPPSMFHGKQPSHTTSMNIRSVSPGSRRPS